MKSTLVSLLACALAFSLSFGIASVAADPYPDPETVYIRQIVSTGSGCPPPSAVVALSSDARALTIKFRELNAEIGPGIPLSQARINRGYFAR